IDADKRGSIVQRVGEEILIGAEALARPVEDGQRLVVTGADEIDAWILNVNYGVAGDRHAHVDDGGELLLAARQRGEAKDGGRAWPRLEPQRDFIHVGALQRRIDRAELRISAGAGTDASDEIADVVRAGRPSPAQCRPSVDAAGFGVRIAVREVLERQLVPVPAVHNEPPKTGGTGDFPPQGAASQPDVPSHEVRTVDSGAAGG